MRRISILLTIIAASTLLASGVALAATISCKKEGNPCDGTPNKDQITGTGNAELIRGLDGNDTIKGQGGDDTIKGLGGHDTMNGDGGNDTMRGGSGNDTMAGGTGRDLIYGNAGNDAIILRRDGGVSVDRLVGGGGNDYIRMANVPARKDVAVCGPGSRDRVVADKSDKVHRASCEKVRRIG